MFGTTDKGGLCKGELICAAASPSTAFYGSLSRYGFGCFSEGRSSHLIIQEIALYSIRTEESYVYWVRAVSDSMDFGIRIPWVALRSRPFSLGLPVRGESRLQHTSTGAFGPLQSFVSS